MRNFHVYYGEVLVGKLCIDEEGRFQYLHNTENTQNLLARGVPLVPPLIEDQTEFESPIAYFSVLLEANQNYSHIEAGVLTDKVRIVEE